MSRRLYLYVFLSIVLVLLSLVAGGALAQSDRNFSLSTDSEFDVPDRAVTFEGDNYEITSITQAEKDSLLSVTGDGPTGTGYDIILYSAERQIVLNRGTFAGEQSVSINLSYSPGTYTLAIDSRAGGTEVVHPVVIKGYDVSVSAAESVTNGDAVEVEIELANQTSDTSLSDVEVVIANQSESVRKTANESGGSYSATIQTDSLSTGEYELYATARGTEQVNGRNEVLGLSARSSLEITEDTDEGDRNDTSSGGGSSGRTDNDATGGGRTTVTGTETPSPTETGTPTETSTVPEPTVTPSPTPSRQTAPTETAQPRGSTETTDQSETTQSGPATPADTARPTDITGTDEPIPSLTPSPSSPTGGTAKTPGGVSPGFTLLVTVAALLITVGFRLISPHD